MAPKQDTLDAKTLAADYGFAYAILKSNPELNKIFTQAVQGTWQTDRFIAALRGTKWFQTHSDSARSWIVLAAGDKATADQRRKARAGAISAEAAALGVKLNTAQLRSLRDRSLLFDYTDQQMRQLIGAQWKYLPTTASAGQAGTTVQQLRQIANDYAVPISDGQIAKWTQQTIEGMATPDDFKQYAINQAKSLFPTMAKDLDAGRTVTDFADPYKQSAVQITGINPDEFNLSDPKWRKAIDQVDPATGNRTVMSLADWQTKLRTDSVYGYDQTAQARQAASQLVTSLGQRMGFMG